MSIVIGIDVGKKNDPTAVCTAELGIRRLDGQAEVHFTVRYLERLPLDTAYPQVAARVGEIVAAVEERTAVTPTLYVDATGVGRPVVDLLEADGLQVIACTFTRGEERSRKSPREVTLGKAYFVSRLQALLYAHRLHLPQNQEAAALVDELLDFEIRVDRNGHDRYGAFRVGTHDDLVTALGLARCSTTTKGASRMPLQPAQTRRKSPKATMIGLDIGTNRAPSGIAVVEVEWRTEGEQRETQFHVRHLETVPASVPYPEFAARLVEIHEKIRQRGHRVWSLSVNGTGLGDPVIDLFRKALPRIEVVPIYFNHGDRRTEADEVVHLGKAWLVSRLKTLLQAHRLHLPVTSEARTLATELTEFKVKVHPKANDHYGAFEVGQRDELVNALGLAAQLDELCGTSLLHLVEAWGPVSEWHPNARPRSFQRCR